MLDIIRGCSRIAVDPRIPPYSAGTEQHEKRSLEAHVEKSQEAWDRLQYATAVKNVGVKYSSLKYLRLLEFTTKHLC